MKSYIGILFTFILYYHLCLISLSAHHTGSGLDTTQFNVRFLDQEADKDGFPPTYFIISNDYNRGARENRNINTTTIYGESIFMKGLFTVNADFSYIYYDQKERNDFARYGKPNIGSKLFPFVKTQAEKNYFLFLEGRIGFPTSGEKNKFIESNYYTAQGNIAFGYLWKKFSIVGRFGGDMPISRYQGDTSVEYDEVPYILRPPRTVTYNQIDNIQLKKTTNASGFISYILNNHISFFSGYLYRTPFNGIQKERSTGDKIPLIFREVSFGLNYRFSEKYMLTVSYRNPLYRGRDFRIYESSINIAFIFNL
ncbi:MAG: hypothetical protein IPL26_23050 [Leptospiraceae bacterium]|nr:hypothetical protein [Leptospiraceae bacterium]